MILVCRLLKWLMIDLIRMSSSDSVYGDPRSVLVALALLSCTFSLNLTVLWIT